MFRKFVHTNKHVFAGMGFAGVLVGGLANESAAERVIQEHAAPFFDNFKRIEHKSDSGSPPSPVEERPQVEYKLIEDVKSKDVLVAVAPGDVSGPAVEVQSGSSSASSSSSTNPFRPVLSTLANSLTLPHDIVTMKAKPPTVAEVDAVSPVMKKIVRSVLIKNDAPAEESLIPIAVDLTTQILMDDSLRALMLDDVMGEIVENYAAIQKKEKRLKPEAKVNPLSGAVYQPTHSEVEWSEIQKRFPCNICCDVLAAPHVLECSHSFCWSCIEDLKGSCEVMGDANVIVVYDCPSCRSGFIHSRFEPLLDKIVQAEVDKFEGQEKEDYLKRREKFLQSERRRLKRLQEREAKKAAAAAAAAAFAAASLDATKNEGKAAEEPREINVEHLGLVVAITFMMFVTAIATGRKVWA